MLVVTRGKKKKTKRKVNDSEELARATRPRGGLVRLKRAVEEMPTWAGRGGNRGHACTEGCRCRIAPDAEGEHPVKHWSGG